jgi:TPR repeat protein
LIFEGFFLNRFLSIGLGMLFGFFFAADSLANCGTAEELVASCQIAGQEEHVSICLSGDNAIYRFALKQEKPDLELRVPLMDLGYLRTDGAKITIDETIIFSSGDYAYQASFGFRDGLPPDPTQLHEYGTVKVLQKNKTITELNCAPETIKRAYDLLLDRMRKLGRERATDGQVFPNYEVHFPGPVLGSPPCEQKSNVDSCWSLAVAAERGGDLALALEYYDKSCDAELGLEVGVGCYDAGKLYLQNRKLRDYVRAYDRFIRVCQSDEIGQGPYACKYLGWMHHTGIGAKKDPDKAWSYLSQACFLHNDELMIDAEGCHFFAEAILKARPPRDAQYQQKRQASDYLAYLALAMGCNDGAEGVCDEAKSFLASGKAGSATWISQCDQAIGTTPPAVDCAGLIKPQEDYDTNQALRRQIFLHFENTQQARP